MNKRKQMEETLRQESKEQRKEQTPNMDNNALWDLLKAHAGHHVEIALYGDPEDPTNISLEDLDTNEVILDAEMYTFVDRSDMDEDIDP